MGGCGCRRWGGVIVADGMRGGMFKEGDEVWGGVLCLLQMHKMDDQRGGAYQRVLVWAALQQGQNRCALHHAAGFL
jgi:hypothetical protein